MRPDATATSIWAALALAKTSAGAPSAICVASWLEPAKLKTTAAPGLAALKAAPISAKGVGQRSGGEDVEGNGLGRRLAPRRLAAEQEQQQPTNAYNQLPDTLVSNHAIFLQS